MFENDIFEKWLDEEAQRVLNKLKSNEPLSQDDKLVIVIKGLSNHIYHIDVELRHEIKDLRQDMDKRFEQVDKRFEQVDKRFEQVDKRFEQVDKRFEQVHKSIEQISKNIEHINDDIKKVYLSLNSQTWKMIGAVGLIVLLGKLIETFGR